MAILADQDSGKKKGSAPGTSVKGKGKGSKEEPTKSKSTDSPKQ
jgi:hypothetical protein